MVASAATAGAGLGLAFATAAMFAAISLRWPSVDGMLYLGLLCGAVTSGIVCYCSDATQRFRLQCVLATACIGAFVCMIIVFGSGTVVAQLLPHGRTTADLAFDVTLAMVPFAMIGGAIGGGALGPLAERTITAWGHAIIHRFGRPRAG